MEDATFNPLESVTASINIGDVAWLLFLFVLGAYVIFTAIFYFHWQQYSTNARVTWLTYVVYLASTLPLLVIMGTLARTM